MLRQPVLLRGWMFCMELRTSASTDAYRELGAKVIRLHFHGFLEAMMPYFPPGCRGRVSRGRRIFGTVQSRGQRYTQRKWRQVYSCICM